MELAQELAKEFAKVINAGKQQTKTETIVYGTTVEQNGKMYVKIDGSDQITPITTTTAVKDGQRVTVMIKNHTATVTGNLTAPSASVRDIDSLNNKISEFEIVMAHSITTDDLNALNANINNIKAIVADVEELEAVNAQIESLEAMFAELEYVDATNIDAVNAEIEKLEVMFADITDLSAEDLEAVNAEINNLKAYTADFTYVSAEKLEAMEAQIKNLTVEGLDALYANIDFSNIGQAAMEYFYAESGLIKDVTVGNQTITGELVGVTIRGDRLIGGTVIADKLVIQGEDGLYYKLNFDGGDFLEGEEVPTDSLHGSVITANSITAEKISVTDLVAFDATIGGFKITEDSIYSGVKESVNNTTRGVYLDNTGQIAFGDTNNYIKYYKDTDGKYKLAISADEMVMSSSGKTVEDAIDDAVDSANTNTANQLKNYSTTAQMNSAIKQSADSITSTVSATYTTKEEFSNLEIGGRNLVVGSATYNFKNNQLEGYVGTLTVVDDTDAISKKHIEVKCTTAGRGFYSHPYKCKAGITYTYSFWAKCSVTKSGGWLGFENGGTMAINLTTEWQYYKHTFTATDKTNNAFINYLVYNANEIFYIRDFKLEEGTKATTWTPAPEDVDSSISSVDTKATNAQSTANTANSKATTNANNITGLTTRVTNAESSITQNANNIALKVSKGDVISTINQSAEEVTIQANKISLEGTVTANDNFKILEDGSMEANNGTFNGSLTSDDVTVTGGDIELTGDSGSDSRIRVKYEKSQVSICPWRVDIDNNISDNLSYPPMSVGYDGLIMRQNDVMTVWLQQGSLQVWGTISASQKLLGGTVAASNELQSTSANGLRIVQGNYGFFIRNDGSQTYFLLTASGDQYGSYNSLRPLSINDSSGAVTIGNGLTVGGGITSNNSSTFKMNLSVDGTLSANYLKAGPTNGTAIRLIRCGTTVLTPGSSTSTGVKLFTHATVKGWYSSASPTSTAVLVCNGDGGANGVHIEGATYNSDAAWYIVCNSAVGSNVRVNYAVICW